MNEIGNIENNMINNKYNMKITEQNKRRETFLSCTLSLHCRGTLALVFLWSGSLSYWYQKDPAFYDQDSFLISEGTLLKKRAVVDLLKKSSSVWFYCKLKMQNIKMQPDTFKS